MEVKSTANITIYDRALNGDSEYTSAVIIGEMETVDGEKEFKYTIDCDEYQIALEMGFKELMAFCLNAMVLNGKDPQRLFDELTQSH